jgi:hypothetical protein
VSNSDELDKPCQMIHTHHLSRILDSAIRGSNAQFDKPEIINKIQVKMTIVKFYIIYFYTILLNSYHRILEISRDGTALV